MQAPWHRPLLAVLLALAVLPYFMARAFPHECHAAEGEVDAHEAAWVASDCALCDLALPLTESLPEPMAYAAVEPPAVQVGAVLAHAVCPVTAGYPARGPPQG